MNRQPFLYWLTCLSIGILLATYYPIPLRITIGIFVSVLLIFLLSHFYQPKWSGLISLGCFINLGMVITSLQVKDNLLPNINQKSTHWMQIQWQQPMNQSNYYANQQVNILAINQQQKWVNTSVKGILKMPKKQNINWDANNIYLVYGSIKPIEKALNPYQFDYAKYLQRQNVYYEIRADTIIIEKTNPPTINTLLMNYRRLILEKVNQSSLSKISKESVKALTIGDRTEMSYESKQSFSQSGLMHLFAISGMHVGLCAAVIAWLLNFIPFWKKTIWRLVVIVLFVWIFGLFIGLSASVVRAVLMLTIYYVFDGMNRLKNTYHVLYLSAFIILIFNPMQLFDVGFQLSYAAVYSIIWLNPIFMFYLEKYRDITIFKFNIKQLFTVTLAAQIGTFPLVIFYFHQYSYLSYFSNLMVIPFVGYLTFLSFYTLFQIVFIPTFTYGYNWIDTSYLALNQFSNWVSSQTIFQINQLGINEVQLAILFVIIYFFGNWLKTRKWRLLIGLGVSILVFQMSRIQQDLQFHQEKLIVFHHPKNTNIGIKNNHMFQIISSDTLDNFFIKNSLTPFQLNEKIHQTKNYLIPKHSKMTFHWKKYPIIFLQDEVIPNPIIPNSILIIENSPKLDWNKIPIPQLKMVVLSGNNYPNYIQSTKEYFKSLSFQNKLWITKEMGAYIISQP